jgi:hypothetical protein
LNREAIFGNIHQYYPKTKEQTMPLCSDTSRACAFNYYKWAKLLVAIPALPLIAMIAASFFATPLTQGIAGITAIAVTLAIAVWLDRIPLLQKKFRKPRA